MRSDWSEDARVLLNSISYTSSIPYDVLHLFTGSYFEIQDDRLLLSTVSHNAFVTDRLGVANEMRSGILLTPV